MFENFCIEIYSFRWIQTKITHQKSNLSLTCPYERQCKYPGTKGHTRTKRQVQGQGYTLPPYAAPVPIWSKWLLTIFMIEGFEHIHNEFYIFCGSYTVSVRNECLTPYECKLRNEWLTPWWMNAWLRMNECLTPYECFSYRSRNSVEWLWIETRIFFDEQRLIFVPTCSKPKTQPSGSFWVRTRFSSSRSQPSIFFFQKSGKEASKIADTQFFCLNLFLKWSFHADFGDSGHRRWVESTGRLAVVTEVWPGMWNLIWEMAGIPVYLNGVNFDLKNSLQVSTWVAE